MNDLHQTKAQLAAEVARLRSRVIDLEAAAATQQLPQDTTHQTIAALHALINAVDDPVMLIETDGTLVALNDAAAAQLHATAAELPGHSVYQFLPPDIGLQRRRYIAQTIATGQPGRFIDEWQGRCIDNRVYPILDEHGQVTRLAIYGRDITAQKQADESLQQTVSKYQILFSALPMGITISDRTGQILETNRVAEKLLSISHTEHLKRRIDSAEWKIVRPDGSLMPSSEYASVRALKENRPIENVELGLVKSPTETIWLSVTAAPLPSSEGGVVITYNDISDRKQAALALSANRDYLQAVLDSANDALFVSDADTGATIDVNQRMCELYGYTREEALRIPVGDLSLGEPPYSEVEAQGWLQQARQIGPQTFEWRAKRKDGSLFWAEVSIRFALFGQAARHVVSVRDISDRQRAAAALRESEERFRLAFRTSPDAININRMADGLYVDVNEGFTTLTGYSRQDVIGKTSLDLQIWHDPADRRRLVAALIEHDACENLEALFRRKDGSLLTGLMSARRIDLQGQPHLLSITRDITERKQAELAERQARQMAEALRDTAVALNRSLDLNVVLDQVLSNVGRVVPHDGANIMLINGEVAYVARVSGRCLAETVGVEQYNIANTPNLCHMQATGEPCIFDHTRANAEWYTMPGYEWIASYAGVPIRAAGDQLVGYLGLYSTQPGHFSGEHTQRLRMFAAQTALAIQNAQLHARIQLHADELEERVRQRTRQLSEANEQLAELDRLKDDFISRISHELRTPLTSIKIYLELLDSGKPEKRAKYMQVLNEQTNRLQLLIENLLEVTQRRANTADLSMRPIDLNHLAESVAATATALAEQRRLTFHKQLALQLPAARADDVLLAQALSNLLNNALNYTPTGGLVELSTAQVQDNGETWLTITIRDTGPGIAPDELPHIFDRFYRGRAAADYKTPGAGVGLFISRDILTALGGRLTVESQPGAGATFTAWLKPV